MKIHISNNNKSSINTLTKKDTYWKKQIKLRWKRGFSCNFRFCELRYTTNTLLYFGHHSNNNSYEKGVKFCWEDTFISSSKTNYYWLEMSERGFESVTVEIIFFLYYFTYLHLFALKMEYFRIWNTFYIYWWEYLQ